MFNEVIIEYGHQMSNISEKWFYTRLSKTHCRPYSKEIIFKPPTRQKLHNYVQKAKDGFHKTKKKNIMVNVIIQFLIRDRPTRQMIFMLKMKDFNVYIIDSTLSSTNYIPFFV